MSLEEKTALAGRPQCSHSFGFFAPLEDNRQTMAPLKIVPLTLLRMAAGHERVSFVCLCVHMCFTVLDLTDVGL